MSSGDPCGAHGYSPSIHCPRCSRPGSRPTAGKRAARIEQVKRGGAGGTLVESWIIADQILAAEREAVRAFAEWLVVHGCIDWGREGYIEDESEAAEAVVTLLAEYEESQRVDE